MLSKAEKSSYKFNLVVFEQIINFACHSSAATELKEIKLISTLIVPETQLKQSK